MSVLTTIKNQYQAKVPNSDYIKTENAAEDTTPKPGQPTPPAQPKDK